MSFPHGGAYRPGCWRRASAALIFGALTAAAWGGDADFQRESTTDKVLSAPSGAPVDWANSAAIYWVSPGRRVLRALIDGSNEEWLPDTPAPAYDVAIDGAAGHLYIATNPQGPPTGTGIYRASLDGTNQVLVVYARPFSLSLDLPNSKIYYDQYREPAIPDQPERHPGANRGPGGREQIPRWHLGIQPHSLSIRQRGEAV